MYEIDIELLFLWNFFNKISASGNLLLVDVANNKDLGDSESNITLEQFIESVKKLDSDERKFFIGMIQYINWFIFI